MNSPDNSNSDEVQVDEVQVSEEDRTAAQKGEWGAIFNRTKGVPNGSSPILAHPSWVHMPLVADRATVLWQNGQWAALSRMVTLTRASDDQHDILAKFDAGEA